MSIMPSRATQSRRLSSKMMPLDGQSPYTIHSGGRFQKLMSDIPSRIGATSSGTTQNPNARLR
jgi:hypothetical protein